MFVRNAFLVAVMTFSWMEVAVSDTTLHVIAHRGASGYVPEHTLAAKAVAHAMGAAYLEQDVVMTKDHVPIVLHDIHLETVSDVEQRFPDRKRDDGRFYSIDFTLQEIKQLEVHERTDPKTGRAVYPNRFPNTAKTGLKIPTLAEEIAFIQGLNRTTGREVGIYPEVKQPEWHRRHGFDISRAVLAELTRFGYTDKQSPVYFQCFEPDELKRVRSELDCQLRLIQLIGGSPSNGIDFDAMTTDAGLSAIAEYADGIGPALTRLYRMDDDGNVIPTSLAKRAQAKGLEVHPYTVRKDALPPGFRSFNGLLEFLSNSPIDAVFSDFPDITREGLKRFSR